MCRRSEIGGYIVAEINEETGLTQRFAERRRGRVKSFFRAVVVDLNWDGALNDDLRNRRIVFCI